MKTTLLPFLVAWVAATSVATADTILERGPHHAVIQTATGGTYTEVATGLNHQDATGAWVPSREQIAIVNGYGVAREGQHQVIFSPSASDVPAIDLLTPDGQRLQSRVSGLLYYDSASGQSAWMALTRDSGGLVQGPNVVLYPDALAGPGIEVDLRYTYRRHAFSQDLVIRAQLPDPALLNPPLDPDTVQVQLWTEFFAGPEPQKRPVLVYQETDPIKRQTMVEPDRIDQYLAFGTSMEMRRGIAFTVGVDGQEPVDPGDAVRVCKSWLVDPETGRRFLIESVPYASIEPMMQALPVLQAAVGARPAGAQVAKVHPTRQGTLAALTRPAREQNRQGSLQLAKVDGRARGRALVLDYTTINSSQSDYRFKSDTTYYISAAVTLSGSSPGTVFEAGTVLKFASGGTAKLTITGPITWEGSPYLPVVLCAKDDNRQGESISGSSGSPSGFYADIALDIDAATADADALIQNVRISHARTAIALDGRSGHVITHAQLVNCGTGLRPANTIFRLGDALLHNVQTNFNASSSTGICEHLTVNVANWCNYDSAMTLNLTNALLVAVTNYGTISSNYTLAASSDSGVFTTVGNGSHYLASEEYRNSGTTNVTASLLEEIRKMTTYPPVVRTADFKANTVLRPQAARDTDTPDVGAHYWPLDYCWSGLNLTNATLLLTNGVAIGLYGNEGTILRYNAKFLSQGSPTAMNRLVRYTSVQEQPGSDWGGTSSFYLFNVPQTYSSAEVRLRFTDLPLFPNSSGYAEVIWTSSFSSTLALMDCWLRGGARLQVNNTNSMQTISVALTNNLWLRPYFSAEQGFMGGYFPVNLSFRNNLFQYGTLSLSYYTNNSSWEIKDNFFDTVGLTTGGSATIPSSHNGYLSTTAIPGGSNDRTLTTADYQTGPLTNSYGLLANYYYPTNGSSGGLTNLVDLGSRTADQAQLYHYATQVSLSKETNSTVDIGFHYPATDEDGLPLDEDADGLADYLEDRDGDGAVDSGETKWQDAADLGFQVRITEPKTHSYLP